MKVVEPPASVSMLGAPSGLHMPSITISEREHDDVHLVLWQVRGASDAVVDGQRVALTSGSALWLPACATHALTVHANSVVLPMFFGVEQVVTRLRAMTVFGVDRGLRTLFMAYLQWQNSILRSREDLGQQIVQRIEVGMVESPLPMPTSPAARQVAQELKLNPGSILSVRDLAGLAHVSYRTIERAFLAETGMTLGQWRVRYRMHCAAVLLREQMTISQVASRVGYTNISAFGRAFKNHFGASPSRYRTDR